MKKQSLKALALIAIFAISMTAVADDSAIAEVERTAEVSEVLSAGAEKVKAAKKAQINVDRIAD